MLDDCSGLLGRCKAVPAVPGPLDEGMSLYLVTWYHLLAEQCCAAIGTHDIVIAGGMESMSNAPYYLPQARSGYRLGHGTVIDGLIHDGLWDPHVGQHMGECADSCASSRGITRAHQDDHALESFRRATEAAMSGATGMVHNHTVTDTGCICQVLLAAHYTSAGGMCSSHT